MAKVEGKNGSLKNARGSKRLKFGGKKQVWTPEKRERTVEILRKKKFKQDLSKLDKIRYPFEEKFCERIKGAKKKKKMKKVPDKSSTEIRPGISEQIKSGTSASLRELREAVPAAVTETHARNCDSGEIRTEDYSVRRIDGKIGSCGLQPCTVS